MKKRTLQQIISAIISLIIVFIAYFYVTGGTTIFKGQMEGKTIRCRVIRVTDVNELNATGENTVTQITFNALVLSGEMRGKSISVIQEIDRSYAFSPREVKQGDKILVESHTENNQVLYYFGDYIRTMPLIILGSIFCILILIFSRSQGIKTIVSLTLTCISVFMVLLPAILNGKNIYLWSVLVCIYITVMTLTLISGFDKKTICAAIGCFGGFACAGILTVIFENILNMTGLLEEESIYLYQLYPDNPIDMKAIIFAMITVGALGAVMDVAVSISSSLWEIKVKSPSIKPYELMKSGFTIGRDMLGTMSNTLVLAYIGSSLTCVLLLVAYNASIHQVLNKEIIIADILQALAGSIGMLLTLPLTSAVCAIIYYRKVKDNASGYNG